MKYFLDHDARGLFDRTGTNATLDIVRTRYIDGNVTMLRGLKLVDDGDTRNLVKGGGRIELETRAEKAVTQRTQSRRLISKREIKIVQPSQIIIDLIFVDDGGHTNARCWYR
jgi:hypothetical protein